MLKNKLFRRFLLIIVISLFIPSFVGAVEQLQLFYFSNYPSDIYSWTTRPEDMIDGNLLTFTTTAVDGDIQYINFPFIEYLVQDLRSKDITKIEFNFHGNNSIAGGSVLITPIFLEGLGTERNPFLGVVPADTIWYDITTDPNAPSKWKWNDIKNISMRLRSSLPPMASVSVSIVRLRITFDEYQGNGIEPELIQNTTTGAEFYLDKTMSYGDFLGSFLLCSLLILGVVKTTGDWEIPKRINFKRQ